MQRTPGGNSVTRSDQTQGGDQSATGDEADGLSVAWIQETEITGALQGCTPAVDDEHLYVGDLTGRFYALSRSDGSVVWSQTREGALSDSSPCHHDGTVFVGSGGGAVHAFDAADGSERWTYSGASAITASPVVREGVLYVGRNDGDLLALDTTDGTVRWQVSLGEAIHSTPAVSTAREAVYVATAGGSVHARATVDGAKLWTRQFGTDVGSSSPVVDGGLVYFVAGELFALEAASGETAWGTSFFGASAGSSPAVGVEQVYVGGGDGTVYAVEPPEGPLAMAPAWEQITWDVSIVGDLSLTGGQLVAASLDGGVYALDSVDGTEIATASLPCKVQSAPVVADGEVYVAGCDGRVFGLE